MAHVLTTPKERRENYIELFAAALNGLLAANPATPETQTLVAQQAATIADAAMGELDKRESNPQFQLFFMGGAGKAAGGRND